MICPECYAHVRRIRAYSLTSQVLTWFTPYDPFFCQECRWRGMLSMARIRMGAYFQESLLGWFIGIVIALSIAWLVVGDLQTNTFKPSDASTEIKWGW